MIHYDYQRPTTMKEAQELLADRPGARFVAGGTDLLVQIRKRRLSAPSTLISLRNVPELSAMAFGDRIRIGAAAPLTQVAEASPIRELFPALVESIRALGSRQIRNVATLGGNLCNASPAADTAGPLLVYEAQIEVLGAKGRRKIPVREFFTGPGKTALRPGELVTAVLLDPPPRNARAVFSRKGRVKMDLAIVAVTVLLTLDGDRCQRARIAASSVAPTPLRLQEVETVLEGARLTDTRIEKARQAAMSGVAPISDVRSTEEYRRHLVGVYVARAVRALVEKEAAA